MGKAIHLPESADSKLPSPRNDDLSQGILETIDLDSYRNEARDSMAIKLEDEDSEIAPVPAGKTGHIIEPELDLLSVIISEFNDMFGNVEWKNRIMPADRYLKSLQWSQG